MPLRHRATACRPAALLAALLAIPMLGVAPAARADWTTPLPASGKPLFDDATFYRLYNFPRQFAGQNPTGFDLLGPRLLGYARDGRLLEVGVQPLAGAGYDLFDSLQRGAGEGLVAASIQHGVATLDGDGALRWSMQTGSLSSPPVVGDDGSIFYVATHYPGGNQTTVHLHRLLPDGSAALDRDLELALNLGDLGFVFELQLHRLQGSADLLVSGSLNYSAAFAARVSPQGERRWSWRAPGRLDRYPGSITVAPQTDGGVLFALMDTTGSHATVHSLDAHGSTRSLATLPSEPGHVISSTSISPDARIYQLQGSSGGVLLLARDALGRELWRQARPEGCRRHCVLLPTANGDLWISGSDAEGYLFERYSAGGQLRFAHHSRDFTPRVLTGTLLGERDAEHMLVALRRFDGEPGRSPPPRVWDEWVAFDLQGVARARAVLPALGGTPLLRPTLVREPDGTTRVVTPSRDDTLDRLDIIDPTGRHLGGKDLDPADAYGPVRDAALCGPALCVAYWGGLKAYADGGRGDALWRTPTAELVEALYAFRDGTTLLQLSQPDPRFSDGSILSLRLLDSSGSPRTVPAGALYVEHFDPELGALVTVDGAPQRLRADGSLVPATKLPGETTLGPAPSRQQRQWTRHLALPGGDLVALAAYAHYEDFTALWQSRTLRVVRVAPDGSVRWRRDFTGVGRYDQLPLIDVALSHTPEGDLLLSGRYAGSGAIRLTALRGNSGEVVTQRTVPCPAAACEAKDFAAGPAGAVFGFARAGSSADSQHVALRLDGLFDDTRLPAQAASTGIWYAPEATGQGVLVQAGADGSVGLAWFTHAGSAQQDPAALRWYTLAGSPAAGASEVALTVHVARGGVFAAPPAVAAEPVGTARLWLADCDRLELRVRFDAVYAVGGLEPDGGAEHALTLQRLLPAGEACRSANGTLRPAVRTPDRRVSGVWYTPSTTGQGLLLYRFATEAGAAPLFAGAWFTHDTPGSGQSAADSGHWFTLRGDGTSTDGSQPLAIDQTLGGHLGGVATRNTTRIGQGTLRAAACDTLEFDYRFDDVEVARGFRGRNGRLTLRRLAGECSP